MSRARVSSRPDRASRRARSRGLAAILLALLGIPAAAGPLAGDDAASGGHVAGMSGHAPEEEVAGGAVEEPVGPVEEEAAPATTAYPSEAPLGWRQAGRDLKYVYTRPAHLDREGWKKVAWTLGAAAGMYLVRQEVAREIQAHHNQDVEDVLTTVRDAMGKVGSVGAVSLGYLLTGAARDSDYDKETAQILAESVLYALPITGVGGRILATQRPAKGDDINFLQGEGHSVSADVTIAASMLAPVIDRHLQPDGDDTPRRIFWKRFGTWSMYSLAGMVALQRMYTDRHYLPDVFLGYANGLTVGRLIVDHHRGGREWRDRRRSGVRVEPMAGGLRITWGAAAANLP